jgi:hypothetical protein
LSIVTEHGVVVGEGPSPVLRFGRSPEVDAQVGHAPQYDEAVPRIAGDVSIFRGNPVVTNLGERFALTVHREGTPPVDISPGQSFGPGCSSFDVVIEGVLRHRIRVVAPAASAQEATRDAAGTTTNVVLPEMTDRQLDLLECYVEPLRSGGKVMRTHQQVAEVSGVSRSLVRLEMNAVWLAFDRAGVPMREFNDRIVEVVDAWLRHDLREHPASRGDA